MVPLRLGYEYNNGDKKINKQIWKGICYYLCAKHSTTEEHTVRFEPSLHAIVALSQQARALDVMLCFVAICCLCREQYILPHLVTTAAAAVIVRCDGVCIWFPCMRTNIGIDTLHSVKQYVGTILLWACG